MLLSASIASSSVTRSASSSAPSERTERRDCDCSSRTGGFHSELVALINDHALEYLEAPVARVTGFDVPMPYLLSEDLYIPDAGRVLEAMQAVRTY